MPKHHIIIGASAAGISVVNRLARLQPDAHITVVAAQIDQPYNKCHLADYLVGQKSEQEIFLNIAARAAITLKTGVTVTAIDPVHKTITCCDGATLVYDTLFLGMGSNPFIPPVFPSDLPGGIFTFHTLRDSNAILGYIEQKQVKSAIVIGAGLSGLECADVLQKNNIAVTILERQPWIMHQLYDENTALFLQNKIEKQQVTVLCGQNITKMDIDDHNKKIHLASGLSLPADMIIVATGARANTLLAQKAGIKVSPLGIVVDHHLQTSIADIYAGGDIIAVTNLLTGQLVSSCTWPDAMLQGIHAAHAMAGQPKPYSGASIVTSSAFFGVRIAQAGINAPLEPHDQLVIKEGDDYYHRFIVRAGSLKGFSVVGNYHNLGALRAMILTGQQCELGL